MKTAISIPQQVFESAEKLAQRLGKSRSQLYTQALKSYLEKQNDEEVTRQLDEVYGEGASSLDAGLQHAQLQSLDREAW